MYHSIHAVVHVQRYLVFQYLTLYLEFLQLLTGWMQLEYSSYVDFSGRSMVCFPVLHLFSVIYMSVCVYIYIPTYIYVCVYTF